MLWSFILYVFHPVSKFGMYTFVSYTLCLIVFYSLTGGANKIFGFLVGEQKGENLQRKGNKPNEAMVQR